MIHHVSRILKIYQIDCVLIQNEHTIAEYVCIAYTTFTTTITNTTASLNFAASDHEWRTENPIQMNQYGCRTLINGIKAFAHEHNVA